MNSWRQTASEISGLALIFSISWRDMYGLSWIENRKDAQSESSFCCAFPQRWYTQFFPRGVVMNNAGPCVSAKDGRKISLQTSDCWKAASSMTKALTFFPRRPSRFSEPLRDTIEPFFRVRLNSE